MLQIKYYIFTLLVVNHYAVGIQSFLIGHNLWGMTVPVRLLDHKRS
jgi:hypothetical protein